MAEADINPNNQPQPESSPAPQRRQRQTMPRIRIPLTNVQIILIVLVIVGGRLVYDFSQRIVEGQEKIEEELALQAEIQSLELEQRQLETAKEFYGSAAYVEVWAHNEGKMVRDGERLIIPLYDQSSAPPDVFEIDNNNNTPAVESFKRWHVWWSLFFDIPPPFG